MKRKIEVWFSEPLGDDLEDQADAAAAALENLSDCLCRLICLEPAAIKMVLFDTSAAKCSRELRLRRLTGMGGRCSPA